MFGNIGPQAVVHATMVRSKYCIFQFIFFFILILFYGSEKRMNQLIGFRFFILNSSTFCL